ncbi:amine oxidase [Dyadobacter arcticus]|uniref:Amine oxidase n=1 Tax=Dyadobacter arcticus TaxID=1078754 RepID=A0ABX0UIQ9_9BACT|nr:amine oxidase [Dyadobacter arcticus]NIJ52812.1 hypothetical protein [Dyadobacter arcticus]
MTDLLPKDISAFLPPHNIQNPFKSFWMGGFECTDQLNIHGDRVDLSTVTRHLELIEQDYERIKSIGITTVREGIRWSMVEYKPYCYDFSSVRSMILSGQQSGIQQLWDICHFGYPDDLSPLHPHFTARFTALCKAFGEFFYRVSPFETLIVTPINEVSFISWLGGDVAGTSPYCRNNGWDVKYALMRAYIAGIKALKEVNPDVRIMTTEPLVNMVPANLEDYDEKNRALVAHELQYQSVDMLCGRICPELGGSEDLLDILGFNYYYNNQWVAGTFDFLGWNDPVPDPRWRSLSSLLKEAYLRYKRPVVLSETSHPGSDRPLWIKMVGEESFKLIRDNIPLWGVCLYPIIDRPDWDNLDNWHSSGLWDMNPEKGLHSRILHQPSADALLLSQKLVGTHIG